MSVFAHFSFKNQNITHFQQNEPSKIQLSPEINSYETVSFKNSVMIIEQKSGPAVIAPMYIPVHDHPHPSTTKKVITHFAGHVKNQNLGSLTPKHLEVIPEKHPVLTSKV